MARRTSDQGLRRTGAKAPVELPRPSRAPYVDEQHAGVIQLVECQLPKLDVVGSSPIARSRRSGS